MAQHTSPQTTFEPSHIIEPIYTGGGIALSADGQLLATSLSEDVLLSYLHSGRKLARMEGVSCNSTAAKRED